MVLMFVDGCLDPDEGDHAGLMSITQQVNPVCDSHVSLPLSRADCWALAGNVAIEEAGGVTVPFRFGRTDCANQSEISDAGLLPSANPGGNPWDHVLDVFKTRGGLSEKEIVALMGAHSIGRLSSDPAPMNAGFSKLPWVQGSFSTLTSEFYRNIEGRPWVLSTTIEGEWLHSPQGSAPNSLALNTDMAMVIDVSSCSTPNTRFGGGGNSNPSNCAINAGPNAHVITQLPSKYPTHAPICACAQKRGLRPL